MTEKALPVTRDRPDLWMNLKQSYGDSLLASSPRETLQTEKDRTRFEKSLLEETSSQALQHALRDTLFDSDSNGDASSYFLRSRVNAARLQTAQPTNIKKIFGT